MEWNNFSCYVQGKSFAEIHARSINDFYYSYRYLKKMVNKHFFKIVTRTAARHVTKFICCIEHIGRLERIKPTKDRTNQTSSH